MSIIKLQVRHHFFLSFRLDCFKSMNAGQKQEMDPLKKKKQPQEGDEDVHLLVVVDDGCDCNDEHQHDLKSKEEKEEEESSSCFLHYYKTMNQALLSFSHATLFVLIVGFIAGMFCSKFLPSMKTEQDRDSYPQVMEKLRFEAATASIEIMLNNPIEEAAASTFKASNYTFVDIGSFCDVVETALDTVGIRGVYMELLETQQFAVALTAAARAKGILHLHIDQQHNGQDGNTQPSFSIMGINNSTNNDPKSITNEYCAGCLWWLRHWTGAITADKLLRDGSLLLDSSTGERIQAPAALFKEIQHIQRMPYADLMSFHAQHGFAWHYVVLTRPWLDEYPLDLAEAWCGDLLYRNEYVEDLHTGISRNCRHAFGHATFYALFMRETGGLDHFSVRQQFQPRGGYFLSDESLCEGIKICHGAPSNLSVGSCMEGFRHSVRLASIMKANMTDYVNKLEAEKCEW